MSCAPQSVLRIREVPRAFGAREVNATLACDSFNVSIESEFELLIDDNWNLLIDDNFKLDLP